MDTALEQVAALRQTSHFEPAALQGPGSWPPRRWKPTSAFGDDRFAGAVQRGDEPSPKLLHLRKGVGLATLIDDRNKLPLFNEQIVRFEVPVGIGSAGRGFGEQIRPAWWTPPAPTFLQKSGPAPAGALNVAGSHSSSATTWAKPGWGWALARVPPAVIRLPVSRIRAANLRIVISSLGVPQRIFRARRMFEREPLANGLGLYFS